MGTCNGNKLLAMSDRVLTRRWQVAIRLTAAALVWSAGLLLAALLAGVYKGQTISSDAGITLTTRTFVQVHGFEALVLVLLPVVVCAAVAIALWQRRRGSAAWSGPVAWAAVGVLAIESILAITSVGAFLLPAVVLLALSVRLMSGPATPAAATVPAAPVPTTGPTAIDG
jgi:hypothetical protein